MNRSKTAKWFEVKVKYNTLTAEGSQKPVRETYVVDALTFTEAEAAIIRELKPTIRGMFDVVEERVAPYGEIFFRDKAEEGKYYKVHLHFITLDEKSGKDKQNVYYLVEAMSLEEARRRIDEVMRTGVTDYVIVGVNETRIIGVFEHDLNDKTL